MKKYFLSMMSVMMMALVCVGFSACGDDDDNGDGGGSGGGTATVTIDGTKYSMGYAYYVPGGSESDADAVLMFSSINLANPPKSASAKWTYCTLGNIPGLTKSNVPEGTFNNTTTEVAINQPASGKGEADIAFGGYSTTTIKKSGNKYIVDATVKSFEGKDANNVSNVTIHYEGGFIDSTPYWGDLM